MNGLARDVRYALRTLGRSPAFAAVAIATLALGIGGNTAIFSLVHAVLLRPPPFRDPNRLVRITSDFRGQGASDAGLSTLELSDWRDRSGVFEEVCGVFPVNANLTETDQPERVEALLVDTNYFSLLGVGARVGRVFGAADYDSGIAPVVVIADGLWKRRYGSDPAAVGRKLRLDGDFYTIVGVLPSSFHHPGRGLKGEAELWAPAGWKTNPFQKPPQRRSYFLTGALARLKPGVTLARARAAADALARDLRREYPAIYPEREGWTPRIVRLQDDLAGNSRPALLVLFSAVGLVLLIACANVANLLLARASARERELAIRRALGAGRARLVRQLLTESLLLAAAGGALAVGVCALSVNLVARLAPETLRGGIRMDLSVLAFTAAVTIGAGLLFGIAPALAASREARGPALPEAARGSSASRRQNRLRSSLVVAEFALALVLLIGAALLIRSLGRLSSVDPGFSARRVLTAGLWLPQPNEVSTGRYFEHPARAEAYRRILERLAALPGVRASGGISRLPLSGGGFSTFQIEGRGASEPRTAASVNASPGYFETMGIPLRKGRVFSNADSEKAPPVVLVSESLARRDFSAGDAVGKRIRFGGSATPTSPDAWLQIVGVVGDVRSDALEAAPRPWIYRSLYQNSNLAFSLVVRTEDPGALTAAVSREVRAVDADLPVFAVVPMEDVIRGALAERRFAMRLLAIFAGVALALAAIGIYGVMAYAVQQRTREIGIRVALGARPSDVLRLLLRHGLLLTAAGVVLGLLAAVAATRAMSALLFEVSARDPLVFGGIALLLCTVAIVACTIPAGRAARLNPVTALRAE